jgi:hypothetical protein
MSPEHLHLATNHLPFIGLGLAMIPLIIGLLGRSRAALGGGLLMVFLCGWSTLLVMRSGEEALERYEHAGTHGIRLDAEVVQWMETHEEDAGFFAPVFFATAGFATVGLMLCIIRSRAAFAVSWIVFLLCVLSLACGVMIADSGGKIRRPDFRAGLLHQSAAENLADPLHGGFHICS